jgi:hypothetical protein
LSNIRRAYELKNKAIKERLRKRDIDFKFVTYSLNKENFICLSNISFIRRNINNEFILNSFRLKPEFQNNFKISNFIPVYNTDDYLITIFNEKESITYAEWPKYDEAKLLADTYTLVVQVNGKLRDRIEVATSSTNAEIEKVALESEKIKAHLEGLTVLKVVVVPKKLVNIVAR